MRKIFFILPFVFPLISAADVNENTSNIHVETLAGHHLTIAAQDPITTRFKPRPHRTTKINYDAWDEFLKKTVLPTGVSTRTFASGRRQQTGTRISTGHDSKLRLEGNKILLSKFTKNHENSIHNFKEELEAIANDHDITSFSEPEQLALWMNLHNAALIEILADNYPLKKPSEFSVPEKNALLHDAKILNINNTPLSLRDIREKIVYPNWQDPKVFYGFNLGDIASPSLQNHAFTSRNIDELLEAGAREFTNSLRGYRSGKVSKLYEGISQFYFKDFEKDLTAHLNTYMRDVVKSELEEYGIRGTSVYEKDIADITGGSGNRVRSSRVISYQIAGTNAFASLGGETTDLGMLGNVNESDLRQMHGEIGGYSTEITYKLRELEKMGLANGTVTIEDIVED